MALEQRLSLKLSQKLVMTPALQQAIKLLQMTRLELEGVLSQELEENPLLEEPEEDAAEEQGEVEKDDASDADEKMSDIDLDAYFNEYLEASSERPSGTYEAREAVPIEATVANEEGLSDHLLWQLHMMDVDGEHREIAELIIGNLDEDGFLAASMDELRVLGASSADATAYREAVDLHTVMFETSGEHEVVGGSSDESNATVEPPSSEGVVLSDPLSSDATAGWDGAGEPSEVTAETGRELHAQGLDGIAPLELEEQLHCEPTIPGYSCGAVEQALATVQSLDPAGVGYRTLQESLLYQLRSEGEAGTLAYRLVEEYWDLCLRRQFSVIAKKMGVALQDLKEPSERVGELETRPGRRFASERVHYVEPDVHVVNVGGEFIVQVNDDGLPKLRVSRAYRTMLREMKSKGQENEAQLYIREKMRSAMWLIKSLDQRQRTIYKVAESIVKQQMGFFEKGIEYLRPMVLRDVADDIEMHESTVSRVVSNKYIHTPRGLYPMKFFFHSGIDRDIGGDISSLTVKRKIKHLIGSEDPKKPLSDSALMNRLKSEGIQIARRTVAKYRDELRIPSSTDRKQVF